MEIKNEKLKNKLTSLLKEVKEIIKELESEGLKVEIRDLNGIYQTELNISKPVIL